MAAAPATNTAATGAPTITGTAQVGQTLTAGTSAISDAEGLDNVAYAYQWLADDTEIAGATASTYTLTADEEGKAIKVKVSFNDDEGNDEERSSAATVAVAAAPATNTPATGDPTITGTAQVGQTLTAGTSAIADAEGLTNVAYTYQWLADDTEIAKATASAYTLTEAEEGKAIKVRVSFSDDEGNDEARTSAATAAVAAAVTTGSAPSFPDSDSDGTADPVARTIVENTTSGNVGAAVIATDPDGDTLTYSVAKTSDATSAAHLTAFNRDLELDTATGQISAKTAATIDYETRSSYKVLLQVTDSKDAAGAVDASVDDTAVLTVTVTNANEPGTVSVSGTVEEGQELTATLDDPDGTTSSVAWQWSSAAAEAGPFIDIGSAMSAAYTVAAGDAGNYLQATAAYTDSTHNATGQTAAATVAPEEDEPLVAAQQLSYEASTTPQIISASSFTVDEGMVNVGTLAAIDDDTVTADLTWSLSSGDDQSHFTISAVGALSFSAAKDFEAPDDTGANGTYAVAVQVSDGDNEATADLEVTLADIDESSTAPLAPGAPSVVEAGTDALAVKWTAPDHTATITGYDIQYRTVDDTEWYDGPQNLGRPKTELTGLPKDVNFQVRVRAEDPTSVGPWSDYGTGATAFWEADVTVGKVGSVRRGYWGYHNRNRDKYGNISSDQLSYDGKEYKFTIVATRYGGDPNHSDYHYSTDVNVLHNILPDNWLVRFGNLHHRVDNALSGQLTPNRESDPPEWKVYWLERAIDPQAGWNQPFSLSRDPSTSTHRPGHHRTATNPTGAEEPELITAAATGAELETPVDTTMTPTNLRAETAHNQVTLRWTAPTNTGIVGYKIYRALGDGELVVLVADTGNTNTTYVDTHVDEATVYTYAVQPIFSDESGGSSNVETKDVSKDPGQGTIADSVRNVVIPPSSIVGAMSSAIQSRTLVGDPTAQPQLVLPNLPRTGEGSFILPVNAFGGTYRHIYVSGEFRPDQYYSVDLEAHAVYRVSLWDVEQPQRASGITLQQVRVGNSSDDTTTLLGYQSSTGAGQPLEGIGRDTDGATISYVFQTESAGEHTLRIDGVESKVLYEIRIEKLDDHHNSPSMVDRINLYVHGTNVIGWNWGGISPGDQDWFAVTLGSDQTYRFQLRTNYSWQGLNDADIVGLAGADGMTIESTTSATTTLDFTTGPNGGATYHIGIRSSSAQSAGMYVVEALLVDVPGGAASNAELQLGQTFTGFFQSSDDQDAYKYTLQADRKYRIVIMGGSGTAGFTHNVGVAGLCNSGGCGRHLTDSYAEFKNSRIDTNRHGVPLTRKYVSFVVEFSPKQDGTQYIAVNSSDNHYGPHTGYYLLKVTDIGPE